MLFQVFVPRVLGSSLENSLVLPCVVSAALPGLPASHQVHWHLGPNLSELYDQDLHQTVCTRYTVKLLKVHFRNVSETSDDLELYSSE